MIFRVLLLSLVVILSTAAIADDDVRTLVANAHSLKFEYGKRSSRNTVSYWDITFSGDEIQKLNNLLSRAKPYAADKGSILYITSVNGSFATKQRTFNVQIGEQKQAGRPVLFILRDTQAPHLKSMYRLLDDDARTFMSYFDKALEAKTRNVKPVRVKKD